jgi:hypothetical protein
MIKEISVIIKEFTNNPTTRIGETERGKVVAA